MNVVMLVMNITRSIKNVVMLVMNITRLLMNVVMLVMNITMLRRNVAILLRITFTFRVTGEPIKLSDRTTDKST
ncbi:hypothetical protein H6H01_12370 [Nostoc calcicola FACHB-3891]|nr:hypothetical protein [Nostoc calcicola FACHB-3891]